MFYGAACLLHVGYRGADRGFQRLRLAVKCYGCYAVAGPRGAIITTRSV
jgi:hypothetical protein